MGDMSLPKALAINIFLDMFCLLYKLDKSKLLKFYVEILIDSISSL